MTGRIFAVDFDGTCVSHAYPKIGKPIGAERVLKRIVAEGGRIVLNTMRPTNGPLEEAVQWFRDRKIPLHGILKDPGQHHWTDSTKCHATDYIDDLALGCPTVVHANGRKCVDWDAVERILWPYSSPRSPEMKRLDMLASAQVRMREPERTIVCDILANGGLLPDPSGDRYGFPVPVIDPKAPADQAHRTGGFISEVGFVEVPSWPWIKPEPSPWRDPLTDPPTGTGLILVIEDNSPKLVNVEERWMAFWDGEDETEPTEPSEWQAWMTIPDWRSLPAKKA